MKTYSSMEELARDNNVSVRSGFRWLQKGIVSRGHDEEGRGVFILNDSAPDIDGDTDNVMSGGMSRVSKKRDKEDQSLPSIGKKVIPMMVLNPNPSTELKKEREQTELSRLKLTQAQDRKELEEIEGSPENPLVVKKKAEVELVELGVRQYEAEGRLDELKEKRLAQERIREKEKRASEEKERIKVLIDRVKEQVLPFSMHTVIPAGVIFVIYKRIEEALLKCDFLNLSGPEAVLIGEDILTQCVNDPDLQPIIQDSLYRFSLEVIRKKINEDLRLAHQEYLKAGGNLSYRDFIFLNLRRYPAERQSQFLKVVDI